MVPIGYRTRESVAIGPGDGLAVFYEAGKGVVRTLGAITRALEDADGLVRATDQGREGGAITSQVLHWLETRDATGCSEPTVREMDGSHCNRGYDNQLPGCAVRTVSPAMLSRKCSGRRRSQTASDACTRAR